MIDERQTTRLYKPLYQAELRPENIRHRRDSYQKLPGSGRGHHKQDRFDAGVAFERFRGPFAGYKGDSLNRSNETSSPESYIGALERFRETLGMDFARPLYPDEIQSSICENCLMINLGKEPKNG